MQQSLEELAGGQSVRLQEYSSPTGNGTRVALSGLCEQVTLRREDPELPATLLHLTAQDVETGDADFDHDFHFVGPPALVLALLTRPMRQALMSLRVGPVGTNDVSLSAGELHVDVPDAGESQEAHLVAVEQVARLALEIAPHLQKPEDVLQRLADNAARDSMPAVRVRNLEALARAYPDHVLCRATLERATSDPDPEVRLHAGIELREEGLHVLKALAAGKDVEDSCSARAIEALGAQFAAAAAERLLKAALGPPSKAHARDH